MMNDRVRSKVVQPQFADDNFKAMGLTFSAESTHETKGEEMLAFDIQRIDAINNPEFPMISCVYKHPVFFKSVPNGMTFEDQGFVDNGRTVVNLDQSVIAEGSNKGPSINAMAYS